MNYYPECGGRCLSKTGYDACDGKTCDYGTQYWFTRDDYIVFPNCTEIDDCLTQVTTDGFCLNSKCHPKENECN
ncbi:hypothetical protein ACFLRF_05655, partial [Candidatus Altiarchaeota archaeon]